MPPASRPNGQVPTVPVLCRAAALLALGLSVAQAQAPTRAPAGQPAGADPIATGSGPLEATFEAQTITVTRAADGTEQRRWHTARRLEAGEEVYYTVRVRNPGRQPVTEVVITKRMPFGVAYRVGSAAGPACEVQASLDGGATFVPVTTVDRGKRARGKQDGTRYTHLRWLLARPLAPGATALLRFRAVFT